MALGRVSAASMPTLERNGVYVASPLPMRPEPEEGAASRLYPEFGLFWEAMDLLYEDYSTVSCPSPKRRPTRRFAASLTLLDDPNTSLLTPEEADYYPHEYGR